jgi:hypothetical protein
LKARHGDFLRGRVGGRGIGGAGKSVGIVWAVSNDGGNLILPQKGGERRIGGKQPSIFKRFDNNSADGPRRPGRGFESVHSVFTPEGTT